MDDGVVFSMTGEPRGQGRPKTTIIKGHPVIYKDAKSRSYEKSIADLAALAMRGRRPLEGPLSASFRFRISVPKSHTKAARARALAGEEAYLGAYDLSNLVKALEDGMNGVVYVDDRQIVRCWSEKIASATPGVDVKVTPLAPQPRPAISPLAADPTETLPQIVSPPERPPGRRAGDAGQAATLVTVCDHCLCACCWQGEFMCDAARTAGTTRRTIAELQSLGREHPHYWAAR